MADVIKKIRACAAHGFWEWLEIIEVALLSLTVNLLSLLRLRHTDEVIESRLYRCIVLFILTFKVASGSVEREVTLRLRHTFFHRSGV